jgi:hypothetical protein
MLVSFRTIFFVVISVSRIFGTPCFIGVIAGLIGCILIVFVVIVNGVILVMDPVAR